MKTAAIAILAAPLALAALSLAAPANAAGCVKGAVVGGVAGHFVGHHGLIGAGVGCAVGTHEAKKHVREEDMRSPYYR